MYGIDQPSSRTIPPPRVTRGGVSPCLPLAGHRGVVLEQELLSLPLVREFARCTHRLVDLPV